MTLSNNNNCLSIKRFLAIAAAVEAAATERSSDAQSGEDEHHNCPGLEDGPDSGADDGGKVGLRQKRKKTFEKKRATHNGSNKEVL